MPIINPPDLYDLKKNLLRIAGIITKKGKVDAISTSRIITLSTEKSPNNHISGYKGDVSLRTQPGKQAGLLDISLSKNAPPNKPFTIKNMISTLGYFLITIFI